MLYLLNAFSISNNTGSQENWLPGCNISFLEQILGKTQREEFPISGFLVNPLQKKIVIIPGPVMILT